MLLAAIEAGASDHAAARAAGVDPRTYRDWRSRAEGRHPTRKATPELIELFREIDEAAARARVSREIIVADKDPKHWLRYKARSQPGLEGWSEPVPEIAEHVVLSIPKPEELMETVRVLAHALGIGAARACPDPACPCLLHKEERDGETN